MIGNRISPLWKIIISILICEATGILSGLLSQAGMNVWFDTLNKPTWNPPSYLFGPIWGLLYLLMGISWGIIWNSNAIDDKKINASIIFFLQLFLNFCWSVLFFKFHSPALALIDILLMDLTIIITIVYFAPISRTAAWLLAPYLCWVAFASLLNYSILSLN